MTRKTTPEAKAMYSLQKLDAGADAATRSRLAFNLESSQDLPEQFKCPVCLDVPEAEIYQCVNGHTICHGCSRENQCSICRGQMTAHPGGPKIRCRPLEDLLDSILLACPFRQNGCLETILGRANVKPHKENCVKDGNCVQLCHHLNFQKACDYWSRATKPMEVVRHLRYDHQATFIMGSAVATMTLVNLSNIGCGPHANRIQGLTILQALNGYFLAVALHNSFDFTLSLVGLRIDKYPGPVNNGMEFKIVSKNSMMPDLIWKVPVLSIMTAETMLKLSPIRIKLSVLKDYYAEIGNLLKINITVN